MYKLYQTAMKAVLAVFHVICYATSVIIPISLTVQVFCRYFLKRPISGIEELAVCCFVLLVFAGSAILFRDRQYIIVDAFFNMFPEKVKPVVDALAQIAMIATFSVLIHACFLALPAQKVFYSVVLKIPRSLYTVTFMISCGFMIICCVEQLFKIAAGMRKQGLPEQQ